MKQTIYLLTLLLGLSSCNNETGEKTIDNKTADTLEKVTYLEDIYIKDTTQYDSTFITSLAEYNDPIKLVDNYILTGRHKIAIPDDLPLNKKLTFKETKNNNNYILTVTRTNLTDVDYNYQLTNKDNKTIETKSGKAILDPLFFVASEMDEDTQTKEGYGSYEYLDKTNGCRFAIRMGYGVDQNGKQRVMLTNVCEGKSKKTVDLNNSPTLRTE